MSATSCGGDREVAARAFRRVHHSSNLALKRNTFSVRIETITHVLTISSQHVAVLAARLLGRQVAPIHYTN